MCIMGSGWGENIMGGVNKKSKILIFLVYWGPLGL